MAGNIASAHGPRHPSFCRHPPRPRARPTMPHSPPVGKPQFPPTPSPPGSCRNQQIRTLDQRGRIIKNLLSQMPVGMPQWCGLCSPSELLLAQIPGILIQEVSMKTNRIVCAVTLALLGSCAVFTPANLQAQDVAAKALNAFQVTVPVNISNFNFTPVSIPAGQRLVIQDIS